MRRLERYQSEAPNPVGRLGLGFFCLFLFTSLTAQGLSYGAQDLQSLSWRAGPCVFVSVAACTLLVVSSVI